MCQPVQAVLAWRVGRWTGFVTLLMVREISPGDPRIAELEPGIPILAQRGFAKRLQLLESPAAVIIGADGTFARHHAIERDRAMQQSWPDAQVEPPAT